MESGARCTLLLQKTALHLCKCKTLPKRSMWHGVHVASYLMQVFHFQCFRRAILIWEADRLHDQYGGRGAGIKKKKIRLWATKVSFSCRHPTDISTLCEVTFSFYLPCHMTGVAQVIKKKTRKTRGSMISISRLKGPLSLLLKPNQYKDKWASFWFKLLIKTNPWLTRSPVMWPDKCSARAGHLTVLYM